MTYKNLENCDPRQCIASKMMRSNRIVSQIFRKHLLEFGLTNSQMSILFIVTKKKADMTQGSLAKALYLEKSTVSRNMRRLFERNFIEKDSNHVLHTTEVGKAFLDTIIPHWDKAMEEVRNVLKDDGEQAVQFVLSKLTS